MPPLFGGERCSPALRAGSSFFVGFRLPMPLEHALVVSGGGGGTPRPKACAPLPTVAPPARRPVLITFAGRGIAPTSMPPQGGLSLVAAATCAPSCARGPPPRACRLGGPPPLLTSPARYARAPAGTRGLRESGVRLRRAFLSADARRAAVAARGADAPLRPGGRVAPCSLRSRCAPSPARPLRPLSSRPGAPYGSRSDALVASAPLLPPAALPHCPMR